jgi:hypothetical protein
MTFHHLLCQVEQRCTYFDSASSCVIDISIESVYLVSLLVQQNYEIFKSLEGPCAMQLGPPATSWEDITKYFPEWGNAAASLLLSACTYPQSIRSTKFSNQLERRPFEDLKHP